MYQTILKHTNEIFSEIKKEATSIGLTDELKGKIGLGGGSGTPPTIPDEVLKAITDASRKVVSLAVLVDQIRDLVKDVYGDAYDVASMSTAEAALLVCFDTLASPPLSGRGENYRSAYIAPYERHLHHQGGYGRPFPPRYRDLFADRGITAGEVGIQGKRLNNVETIFIPLEGARYEVHGIKYNTIPMLTTVDPNRTIEKMNKVAEIHADKLASITSMGYDTIGYGYDTKDNEGTPVLQKNYGKLAKEYNIPYICDNARGIPFVGTDLRKINADIILYSMDKAAEGPTSGLVIGKEEVMIPVRRAMGIHGSRRGSLSSYGKTAYVAVDPGKEALVGQIAALTRIKENPDEIKQKIDQLYKIVEEEFSNSSSLPQEGIHITKSYNGAAVEVNYVDTWNSDEYGIPIFSIEDMYAGSNPIQVGLGQLGVRPPLCYDGNLFIVMGQGNLDGEGNLIHDRIKIAVKGLVRTLEIVTNWSRK
jgi:hypothetical protein